MSKKKGSTTSAAELGKAKDAVNAAQEKVDNFPVPGVEPVSDDVSEGVDPTPFFTSRPTDKADMHSSLKDAVQSVFDNSNMNVKSVLETKHILALAIGRVYAEKYNSKLMNTLCQQLLEMRVSLNGRGRKDLVSTLQSAMRVESTNDDEKSKANRLFSS